MTRTTCRSGRYQLHEGSAVNGECDVSRMAEGFLPQPYAPPGVRRANRSSGPFPPMDIDNVCPCRLERIRLVAIPHQAESIDRPCILVHIERDVGSHDPVLIAPPHQLRICIQQGRSRPDIDYKGIGPSQGDASGGTRNIP